MTFEHKSVFLEEAVDMLNVRDGGIYVDGTLGGGGHSERILSKANCTLIGIDRDMTAIEAATKRLESFENQKKIVQFLYCAFIFSKR